ncbi:MAG: hypothetical protein EG824_01200 [Deltaproteobacteria bacterium]|nr:hypothetical protein [Deltaproteobacteria bacterium]
MDGRREVIITDEVGAPINQVLVVPLYISSFDINIGVEGKPLTKPRGREVAITKPFLFNSGDDIVANQIHSRGIIVPIPPFAYTGSDHTVYRYLMIKAGYSPTVLSHHDVASRRWKPMRRTSNDQISGIIQLLLAARPSQEALRELMNASDLQDPIQIRLSPEDIALLKSAS